MLIASLVRLKLKQIIGGEGARGLIKFLAPDLLIGIFLAISSSGMDPESFPVRVAIVSACVLLFTSFAETRKFFFSGGDLENFYFLQPTALSRLASASGLLFLNLAVAGAIFLPLFIILPVVRSYPGEMMIWYVSSVFLSLSVYFILLFPVALLPVAAANRALTLLQVAMALCLLATFQFTANLVASLDALVFLQIATTLFAATFFLFAVFPISESMVLKLNGNIAGSATDLLAVVERLRKPALARSVEEQAGFMFFLANLFRNSSFRLSTVGVAGTPVMVAVYWSMKDVPFLGFSNFPGFVTANQVAPIASLAVSGVIVYYFLAQNMLSSRDHEAKWQFEICGEFDRGKFVLGARKAFLLFVHIPVTALVFAILMFSNGLAASLVTAVTFYSVGHVAISSYSVMQKRFPFSVPYTRIGATETITLLFMLGYSVAVTILLFVDYGSLGSLLKVSLFAFILVGIIEYYSVGIVNKRVKIGV